MNNLKVGSVVVLKSGSTKMTVVSFNKSLNEVKCAWHDKDGSPQSLTVSLDALQEVSGVRTESKQILKG